MIPSPERVRAIALTLTGWPSVTGTADEAAFSGKLAHYLDEIGGLQVWTKPIPDDALGRANERKAAWHTLATYLARNWAEPDLRASRYSPL